MSFLYTAENIAAVIIQKTCDLNHPVNNLKLNKMLYLVQLEAIKRGYTEGLFDSSKYSSGEFSAWRHGPVCPTIYYALCHWTAYPFEKDCKMVREHWTLLDKDAESVVNKVIEETLLYKPWDLVALLHKSKVWKRYYGYNYVSYLTNYMPWEKILSDDLDWSLELKNLF